ncbi:P-loop containing nucleoside triphosphate hydrolase protein [Thozetella sp. PMI_491]|nr:P-loop containing nucleoside triphosphate hydrolase protein [Thozetella sp. PMI_491]
MTRPFRALIYYEEAIRDLCRTWEADCQAATTFFESRPVKSAEAESPEATTVANADKASRRSSLETQEVFVDSEGKGETRVWDLQRLRDALEHLQCLIQFMDTDLLPRVRHLRSSDCHKVSFHEIWHIFKPGDEVVRGDVDQIYRVVNVRSDGHKAADHPFPHLSENNKTSIRVVCVSIDFDGAQLGPVMETFTINRFDGEKSIQSLPVYPFHGSQELRQKYIARGRKFVDMTEIRHMHYDGLTLGHMEEVDSQVVIDFEEAFVAQEIGARTRKLRPFVENLVGTAVQQTKTQTPCDAYCCRGQEVYFDGYVEKAYNEEFVASLIPQDRTMMPSLTIYPRSGQEVAFKEQPITDDEYLIMSHRAFGFILRSRKWSKWDFFNFDSLGQTEDRETGFDQLVLPPGHKDMVKSLIAQHFRDKKMATLDVDYSDIVRGKGKGLIILLHGAPGVGKTTTAECVAEYFKKPLFQITCGDLGIWAQDVENALQGNFALASRWGCILLLDEADVFLAARTPTDMVRNSLVSVFLRILEYYTGILFLTTNRVGDFDEAFASRVHMSLYYPPLDLQSTVAVFDLNIRRIKKRFSRSGRKLIAHETLIGSFATDYWRNYPKARWNGRQIRNACQTALALAEFEAQGGNHEAIEDPDALVGLEVKHLKRVSDAYLGFLEYLKDIYGVDAEERAKENLLRAGDKSSKQEKSNLLAARRSQLEDPRNQPRPCNMQGVQSDQPFGTMSTAHYFNSGQYQQPYGGRLPADDARQPPQGASAAMNMTPILQSIPRSSQASLAAHLSEHHRAATENMSFMNFPQQPHGGIHPRQIGEMTISNMPDDDSRNNASANQGYPGTSF